MVENLIVNKEQRIPDVALLHGPARPRLDAGHSDRPRPGVPHELLGPHRPPGPDATTCCFPTTWATSTPPAASLYPTTPPSRTSRTPRARSSATCIRSTRPDPAAASDRLRAGLRAGDPSLPVDVALGKVDYYEVVGFSDHLATTEVWYRLLNCGFRIPAGAGTDAMANYASLRGPVGMNRVFVKTGGPLDHAASWPALKAGRTFATNGPLLELALRPGPRSLERAERRARCPPGRHALEARVTLRSIVPVDHLEIVGNGEVVAALPLAGDRTAATRPCACPVSRSRLVHRCAPTRTARAIPCSTSTRSRTTSPVYVTVGGAPVRSAADARYFARLDRPPARPRPRPTRAGTRPPRSRMSSHSWPRPTRSSKSGPGPEGAAAMGNGLP